MLAESRGPGSRRKSQETVGRVHIARRRMRRATVEPPGLDAFTVLRRIRSIQLAYSARFGVTKSGVLIQASRDGEPQQIRLSEIALSTIKQFDPNTLGR